MAMIENPPRQLRTQKFVVSFSKAKNNKRAQKTKAQAKVRRAAEQSQGGKAGPH